MKTIFKNKAQTKEVITFDIFDTLLHRKAAAPTDIFDFVRAYFLNHDMMLKYHDLLINFPHLRRISEALAREQRTEIHKGEGEITFDEIYEALQQISKCDNTIKEALKKAELFLESEFLYCSTTGHMLYKEAKRQNKKIYFISDMYLPTSFLKDLLKKNGYDVESNNQIFVSAEHRVSKHNGKLFEHFLESENIDPSDCLHIGDNLHADIKQASAYNIDSLHANWAFVENQYKPYKGHFNDYIARSITKHITFPQHHDFLPEEPYEKLGYQIWGPLIFGYMIWLANEIKKESVDTALFFARDADLIMDLYKTYFLQYTPDLKMDFVYLSRASMLPLAFTDWPMHRLWAAFGGKSERTIKEAMETLQIDIALHLDDVRQVGFSSINEIITKSNEHQMHHLINKLYQPVMLRSKELRQDYQKYFQDFVQDASKIALVDIGWAGNIQAMFLRILGKDWIDKDYIGLYLGTSSHTTPAMSPYVNFRGWIMSNGDPKEVEDTLTSNGGVELLEFALTTNYGSTLGYKEDKGNIIPVLEKSTEDQEISYAQKALSVQKGIKMFFEEYKFLLKNFSFDSLESREWSQPFLDMVNNPQELQLELLASLSHSDTAGKNSTRLPLAQEVSEEAKKIKNEEYRDAYEKAYWKSAFEKINSI